MTGSGVRVPLAHQSIQALSSIALDGSSTGVSLRVRATLRVVRCDRSFHVTSRRPPETRCEEFQRYAKVVCLKGDAVENKSFAQSLDSFGACYAARAAATKVEAAQRANVEAHQRAWEAKRQLQQMGIRPDREETRAPSLR
jgi:hypothetical protein